MSAKINRTKRSEKGLLTPDNCVIALIDYQPQMMFGTANFDRQSIINNTIALAKAARVFDVPVVLTAVETKSFSGNFFPQIRAVFPDHALVERSSMNSWDDKNFVAAIKATRREKLVLAGLWTETCIALPTVQAIHDGYEIYVAEDCCGDVSQLAHDNAMKRMIQAGAKPVTSLSLRIGRINGCVDRTARIGRPTPLRPTNYGAGQPRRSSLLHPAECPGIEAQRFAAILHQGGGSGTPPATDRSCVEARVRHPGP
jgi:nicotinamidase-related amidase